MDEPKFTPGPWVSRGENLDRELIIGWQGLDLCIVLPDDERPDRAYADAALIRAAPALYERLALAAKQFRLYEKLHREKDTDDGRKKANSNMIYAQLCERTLAEARGETRAPVSATEDAPVINNE